MLATKKRFRNKKSQILGIPFNMLFAIILIIIFLAVAIYAIVMFLNLRKCADTASFKYDLQQEIDRAYSSDEASNEISLNLPSAIEKVCFIDLNKESKGKDKEKYSALKKTGLVNVNMFFYPLKNACGNQKTGLISHINISEITKQDNPYCLENTDGKVKIRLEKSTFEALVKIR